MNKGWLALFVGIALLVAGCGGKPAQADTDTQGLEQKIQELENQLKQQDATMQKLESDLLNLRLSVAKDSRASMALDISTPGGYSRVDSDGGTFFVALDDVQQYMKDNKLILRVGNPSNVTYSGFDLTIAWGFVDSMMKTQSYTSELSPGAWNRVEFILPAAATELPGPLRLSIKTDRLSLRKPL